jgi:hypothetical protein
MASYSMFDDFLCQSVNEYGLGHCHLTLGAWVLMFHLSVSVCFLFHYLTGVLLRGCVDATVYDEYEINEGIVLIVQTILCALFCDL